jgi:two-component system, cell cycle sensor histidine kinase and response regulator CckA
MTEPRESSNPEAAKQPAPDFRLEVMDPRTEAILSSMSEGVALVDRQGAIVAMNPAALAFYRWQGDPPSHLRDLWPIELTYPDGSPLPLEGQPPRRVGRGETFTNCELRLRRVDTGETWFGSFNGRPVSDGSGGAALGVLTFQEITGRLKAEIALRDSERRFRRLIESSAVGVGLGDLRGGVHYANPAMLAIFGYTAEDVASGAVNWSAITPPEFAAEDERSIAELRATGVCKPFEKAFFAKDGRRVPVIVSGCVLDRESAEPVAAAFITDMSRAREAERRLTGFAQSNVIGIANGRAGGAIDDCNNELLRMIGRTRDEVQQGRLRWDDVIPPEGRRQYEAAMAEARARGICQPYETEVIRPNGGRAPVLVGFSLLGERREDAVAFILDISERKRMEERLRQAQKAESIGVLAAGIAHDFNNLLLGIMGNASLALDVLPDDSPITEALEGIVESAQHAAHLTRQMLAYAGKGKFIIEAVDLSRLAEETFRVAGSSISKKVTCHMDLAENLPAVDADRTQLQQVFTNLILNAAEAMEEGGGALSIQTGFKDLDAEAARRLDGWGIAPGPCVFLAVTDSGCGMDAATSSKMFDPFFTTKFTGRGLGLAAVSGIVRAHRGAVDVDSAPGQGTRFTVLLPASPKVMPPRPAPAEDAEDLRGLGMVLVVDDDEVARKVAKSALELRGYSALTAASGAEALELIRDYNGVTAVVLDMEMPGLSGSETLVELHKLIPSARILVVSGYSEEEMRRVFAGGNVSGFLAKPYTGEQLAAAVKKTGA